MTDHDDAPDLPPDAPLRTRLWFRFGRGWRKVMVGMVVLVVVAWGTRPSHLDHAVEEYFIHEQARDRLGPPLTRAEVRWWLTEDPIHAEPGAYLDFHVFTARALVLPAPGPGDRPWTSIGAFGHVWVLD